MSKTPVVHLELRISPRIFKKNSNGLNGILRGLGETDPWKNLKSKISWHCHFKCILLHTPFFLDSICSKAWLKIKIGQSWIWLKGWTSCSSDWRSACLKISTFESSELLFTFFKPIKTSHSRIKTNISQQQLQNENLLVYGMDTVKKIQSSSVHPRWLFECALKLKINL